MRFTCPMDTPWGRVQESTEMADGVWFVSTSTHGGFWLSDDAQQIVRGRVGSSFVNFLATDEWWEEDCDACIVAIVFNLPQADECWEMLRGMAKWNAGLNRYRSALEHLEFTHEPTDAV